MNAQKLLIALAVCTTASLAAAAQTSNTALAASLQEVQRAGFAGTRSISVSAAQPSPAAAVVAEATGSPADHVKQVLAAYSKEVLDGDKTKDLSGKTARRLGFGPTASAPWTPSGDMPVKAVGRQNDSTGEAKFFIATTARGKTEVVLVYIKDNNLFAYSTSVDGALGAATHEAPDGNVSDVTGDEATAGFEKELGFWVRYYDRTHPSKP